MLQQTSFYSLARRILCRSATMMGRGLRETRKATLYAATGHALKAFSRSSRVGHALQTAIRTGAPSPGTTFLRSTVKALSRVSPILKMGSAFLSGLYAVATTTAVTASNTSTPRNVVMVLISADQTNGSVRAVQTGISNAFGTEIASRCRPCRQAVQRVAAICRARTSIQRPGGCSKSCLTTAMSPSIMNRTRTASRG